MKNRICRIVDAIRTAATGPHTFITAGWCMPSKAGALMQLGDFDRCAWCDSGPVLGVAWQTIDGSRTELLVCRDHAARAGTWLGGTLTGDH